LKTAETIFADDGFLVPGTHILSKRDFLELFCSSSETDGQEGLPRHRFHKPFFDICQWAEDAGATSIVIGGSFVSKKISPSDIDLLIFFATSDQIPKSLESFYVDGVLLDIQLLAEDEPEIKTAFLELLATTRSQITHGLVQIKFNHKVLTHTSPVERSAAFDIVKTAYLGRKYAQLNDVVGLVVPIHGIRTHAEWIPHISLLASTSGWAVAPYYYGYQDISILGDKKAKTKAVHGLREWLSGIQPHWNRPISIIAHSFGSYILARYLQEAKDIAVAIDSIILCGSILTTDFDWISFLDNGKVGRVLNTVAEEDEWVRLLPQGGVWPANDKLFGKAGWKGFEQKHPRLMELRSSLLDHNNMFKFDVILGQWIPFMRLSMGAHNLINFEILTQRIESDRLAGDRTGG
jgi:pimeloyl-ACP methyl ester carboxylesterase